MRTMNMILSALILFGAHVASAKADPACTTCAAFDQLSVKLNNNAPDALDEAVVKLGPIAAGRQKTLSQAEADALIPMMTLMLKEEQRQNGGDAASQLFNIWKRHRQVIETAVQKQSPADQELLRVKRKFGQKLMTEGSN